MKVDVPALVAELSQLLQRRNDLSRLRDEAATPDKEAAFGSEIEMINSQGLPTLSKRIWDARNATKNHEDRKRLKRLHGQLSGATSGILIETVIDISPEAEARLVDELDRGKTNAQRARISRAIDRLRDARARFEAYKQAKK